MLRLADVALAPPAGGGDPRRSAAIGAEAVPRVPRQDRLGLAEHRERVRVDQPLYGDRAQIGQSEVVAARDDQLPPVEEAFAVARQLLDRFVRQQRREYGRAGGVEPQQRFELRSAEPLDFGERKIRRQGRLAARQDRHFARDQHRLCVRPSAQRGDEGGVVAPLRDPVERRAVKAERRRARRCLEKGVIHASSLDRAALAKRGKAGFNPCESLGLAV